MCASQAYSINDYADFWRYAIGLNVIPADTKNKKPLVPWTEWQDKPIPEELHNTWKGQGAFSQGIAIVVGKLWRGPYSGKFIAGIDADNLKAIEEICTHNGVTKSIKDFAQKTIVEQHSDNSNKAHIYFICEGRPMVSKSSDLIINDPETIEKLKSGEIPSFEIKASSKKLMYCSPSLHMDGHPYEIIGTKTPHVLNRLQVEELEKHFDQICRKYGIRYLEDEDCGSRRSSKIPIGRLFDNNFVVHKGNNRHEALLRVMESLLSRNASILSPGEIYELARQWNTQHCQPPLDDGEFNNQWKCAIAFIAKNNQTNNKKEQNDLFNEVIRRHEFKTLRDVSVRNLEVLWYSPIDGLYHRGGEVKIRETLEEIARHDITEYDRNEIVNHVRYSTLIDRDRFDRDPDLLHFANGYYNIATNKFMEGHTQDYLSLVAIPHKYNPSMKCVRINKFLNEVLPPERIKTIIKMWGYCLLRSCRYQKAFMLYGNGRNGKGVLIRLTRGLLGESNCSSVSLQDIGNSRFSIQRLDGKMANTYGDLPQETIQDTSKFKSLVDGGEALDAEQKFHDPYTFKNKSKLIFSANHIPDAEDKSYGYYRRWVLIHFERVFDAISDIKGLGDDLVADENEMSGLINLALIGLNILKQENGFEDMPYEQIKKEYEEGGLGNDVTAFLEECYIVDPLNKKYETRTRDLFEQFDKWCEKKGIKVQDRPSEVDISSVLTLNGCARKQLMRNHERAYYYTGLKLKTDLKVEQKTL